MEFRVRHRKLFYVPGMISLALIPFVFAWYVKSGRYPLIYQSVDFSISDTIKDAKEYKKDGPRQFPSIAFLPKRTFRTISFNGENDRQKLLDLRAPLRKMIEANDTINGYKFHFGKHCSYQTFISAQDLLFVNKAGYYFAHKNNIYVLELPKKKPTGKIMHVVPFECGYSGDEEYFAELERERQKALLIQNGKRFWMLPLAFLGIALLNVFTLIKFNRNRIYNQKSYI